MSIEVPLALLERAREWDQLRPHDRAELGRALRRLGLSYGEIRRLIPVPKGTLAGWCSGIRLTASQVDAIRLRTRSRVGVPRDTQRKRRAEIRQIRMAASAEAPRLVSDPLWVAGTALYWAEGAKTSRRLSMANSDSRVLAVFMAWVRSYVMTSPEFVLKLNLHADNDERAARTYWREALHLPDAQFYRTYIKPDGTGHRKNHLSYGVCEVRVRASADGFFKAMAWVGQLPELLGLHLANVPSGR